MIFIQNHLMGEENLAIRKINSNYIPQGNSEIILWKDYPARAFETIFLQNIWQKVSKTKSSYIYQIMN